MRLASIIAAAFSGGGGLTPPPAKPTAYESDFNSLSNGTLLYQQSGWSAVNSTNPVVNFQMRTRLNVQGGNLFNDTSIAFVANNWLIGYTCQTTDHGIEFTLGTLGTDSAKFPDVALAATDQSNYISCELDAYVDQYAIRTVTGGVTTNISTGGRILGTLSGSFYSGVVGTVLGRTLQAGDKVKWQIQGTIVQLYVNGYPCLGAGVDISAGAYSKGVLCGFHTGTASSNFTLNDLRVADVQARININFLQEFWPALISVGSRTFGVSGTYNGTLSSLQYRVVRYLDGSLVQDWQALASPSISAGVWSGNVTVPIGNLTTKDTYRVEFRSGSDMDVKVSTNEFAVGISIAVYGQSNAQYRYDDGVGGSGITAYSVNRDGWFYNDNVGASGRSTRWRRPLGTTSTRKADALPDQLSKLIGIPVGMVCGGRGGMSINDLADYAGATSPSWTAYMLNMINAVSANGYIYGWLWDQGEADGTTSNGLSTYYNPRYTQLLTLMRGVSVNSTVPVVNAIPGENFNAGPTADNYAGMRRNLSLLPSSFSNVFTAHSWYDLPNVDQLHHTGPAYVAGNIRDAYSLARAMGYTVAYSGRGPTVTGATRSGATITLAINMDGASSISGSGLTDFEVSTNSFASTLTISSVNVVSNQIVITLAADPGAVCQVRSHWNLKSGAGTFGSSAAVMAIATYPDGNTISVEPVYNAITTNV